MADDDFPGWIAERIGECASRLDIGLVERGEPLSPEDEAAGEVEALGFIKSLEIPHDGRRCALLFPRLWPLRRYLDRSQLNPRLRLWEELAREEVLQILLIETWPNLGKKRWEKERDSGPRW